MHDCNHNLFSHGSLHYCHFQLLFCPNLQIYISEATPFPELSDQENYYCVASDDTTMVRVNLIQHSNKTYCSFDAINRTRTRKVMIRVDTTC